MTFAPIASAASICLRMGSSNSLYEGPASSQRQDRLGRRGDSFSGLFKGA